MSKKTEKAPEPMDPSIREDIVGAEHVNRTRACWALKTLVAEVLELFPETPVEYSNPDGRNTMLDASLDLTVLDSSDNQMLVDLLTMLPHDPRVEDIIADYDAQSVLVSFKSNPRTQDSREPFGLSDALLVLAEDADDGDPFLPIHDMLTSHSMSDEESGQ